MRGVELAILKSWYWFIHTLPSRAYSRHSQHFHHLADFVYVASSPFSAAGTDHSFVKHSFPTSYIKHKTSHTTHHTPYIHPHILLLYCSRKMVPWWSRDWKHISNVKSWSLKHPAELIIAKSQVFGGYWLRKERNDIYKCICHNFRTLLRFCWFLIK